MAKFPHSQLKIHDAQWRFSFFICMRVKQNNKYRKKIIIDKAGHDTVCRAHVKSEELDRQTKEYVTIFATYVKIKI